MKVKRYSFFALFVCLSLFVLTPQLNLKAQESTEESPKPSTPVNRKQKKADKKKAKQKTESQSLVEKGMKRHQDIQSKDVQKRMKRSAKTAERNNHHKREPFYKRWFKKDRRSKKWFQFWK